MHDIEYEDECKDTTTMLYLKFLLVKTHDVANTRAYVAVY